MHKFASCLAVLFAENLNAEPDSGDTDGDGECWVGDFNEGLCCGERWGLTGNPICWDNQFTYLRCCGLSAFPRLQDEDVLWDDVRRSHPAAEAGEYDFIIVGSGSAGSVLAARLASAHDADGMPWRVLLLESGPWDQPETSANPDIPPEDRTLWRRPLHANWSIGTDKRTWSYSTGQGLGGTSAVNSMLYTRGSVSEYERFGWPQETVVDAFQTLEAPMEVPGFKPDFTFHRDPKSAGSSGYDLTLVAALPEELPPVFSALISAFEAAGVPFRLDPHGSATIHGIGGSWRSMGCGHPECQPSRVNRFRFAKGRPRSSPYKRLVAPLNRTGGHHLHVVPGRTVERVIFDSDLNAVGVEVSEHKHDASDPELQRWTYRAKREVIISAGVFGSPKLLTLSGIAEPKELERLGIPLTASSPNVGRNLHEHVGVSIVTSTSVDCPVGYHQESEGKTTHLGNLDEFIGQFYAFLNATSNVPGSLGPVDAEVMILEGCLEGKLSLTFTIILLQGHTLGRLVVQSRNPSADIHMDYKPLSSSSDIELLANVIRILYTQIFSSDVLSDFELAVDPPWSVVADFQELAKWLRTSLYYYYHPTGTCRIDQSGTFGVVDSQLRVFGTQRLRVADASVFPESPSGHLDAPTRLVGELASRFILSAWNAPDDSAAPPASGGPFVELNGYRNSWMPVRGLGTNGFEGQQAQTTVRSFLHLGGRLLDTALTYNNHRDIASALAASGVPRSEIFLVSKVSPSDMGLTQARKAIDRIVQDLGTHLDLVLIHWPSNYEKDAPLPPCARPPDGSWRACRAETWQAFEEAHSQGQVRALGVSNFGVRHLTQLLDEPGRKLPVAVNEVEFHPWWPQPALRRFCTERRIALIAYGSTGGSLMGGAMLRAPVVVQAAAAVGKSPAQVLLRWALQHGVTVIPASTSEAHLAENLDIVDWELGPSIVAAISNSVAPQDRMRVYLPDPEHAP